MMCARTTTKYISNIEIGIEHLRTEHIKLTLSNTKRGTDLGTLVVPFDQTIDVTYSWIQLPIMIGRQVEKNT